MMTPKPLAFTQLSATELQLSRLLCGKETRLSTVINETPAELELCIASTDTLPTYALHLEVNGQPYQMLIGDTIVDHLLPKNLDHHALKALPDDLQLAVITHSMASVLHPLSTHLGISYSVQGLEPSHTTNTPSTMGINVKLNGINSRIELQLNELLLSILSVIPTHHMPVLPDIPFWATLEMGHTQLPSPELKHLETGDIVFFDKHVKSREVILRINDHIAYLGESSDTQVRILQRYWSMDEYEMDEHDTEDHDHAGVDLGDLSVTLMFEVGQQKLTLAELQGIQPGYIFELDHPVQQPVNIRANGKLIGHCELVQIENRLGARITHLHDS